MADPLNEVQPGEVISSDAWNKLVKLLNEVQAKLGGIDVTGPGRVAVPDLFGISLGFAKETLMKPKYGLLPGDIFNTSGQRIFPENTAALELAVLNQVPEAGRIVDVGSSVGLVIAQLASSGGGTTPGGNHTVTGMNPGMPTGARLEQEIHILGTNFVAPFNRNHVIFDGEHVAIPKGGLGTSDLLVDVPGTIPGVPRPVQVAVEIDGVTKVLPFLYLISPKSSTPELKITATSADGAFIRQGQNLLITGTGFAAVASQNEVRFLLKTNTSLTQLVTPTNIETIGDQRRLTVPVPTSFPAGMQPNATGVQYLVRVHIVGTNETLFAQGEVQIRTPL
jgi:hypothetical protein